MTDRTVNLSIARICLPAFLSLSLLASCGHKDKKEAQPAGRGNKGPANVNAFIVHPSLVSEVVEVPGTVVADETTEIHPEVAGRITGIYIREGAMVSKGTPLVKLYDADLQAQRRKLQVQLQIARQTLSRHEQLLEIGGISKEDYAASQLNVSNIQADLAVNNTNIDRTLVRAPFTGKLGLREVSVGAYVSTQTVITRIQKTSGLRIDFNVPEKYLPRIKTGQYVNFTVEGSSRNYAATIMATGSGVEEMSRTLQIRGAVQGAETGLTPGAFAKVKISFDPDPNAIMVPSEAVIPQARGKQVFRYHGGVAEAVNVTTGIRDSVSVQVLSGLQPGDTVITTGLLTLKDKGKVKIKRITNEKKGS